MAADVLLVGRGGKEGVTLVTELLLLSQAEGPSFGGRKGSDSFRGRDTRPPAKPVNRCVKWILRVK